MSVGAMEPVGMTNPSVTKPRKVIASTKATISDWRVEIVDVSGPVLAGSASVMS